MKKGIIFIIFASILFSVGYLIGSKTTETVTKEVKIGIQNNKEHVEYNKIFTDAQNLTVIDNILMIYLTSSPTENIEVNKNSPDLFIEINSPKQSTGLINSKMWFTNDGGAIIGLRSGESWKKVDYKRINQNEADYIKGLLK